MKRLHGKKGFTLVEMMVTLAIVGIMLAGSVMGVGAYINYANFRSNNDCAYSLFMTIQSALAQEKASGELEQIKNSYTWDNSIELSGSAAGNSAGRNVQSLIISKGNLATAEGQIFLDIVGDYIYDQSMLDASILVELDITEGTLYSVAYSKQAADFSYTSGNTTDRNGTVSVAFGHRAHSIRRGTQLGYYSSDLPDPAPSSLGKPNISYVMLTNGETLDLSWRMSGRYRVYTQNLVYTVKLTDAAGDELATFKINESGSMIPNDGAVPCDVQFPGAETTTPITFRTHVNSYEIHVTLDKVDLSAAGQIPNYDGTQSAMRLSSHWGGYVGDIRATVTASRLTAADSDPKTSAAENLLFGSPKLGFNTIQNARHLFNLRFIDPDMTAPFKQTATFAWGGENGIIAHGNVENVSDVDTAFPTIPSFGENSTFEGSKNIKIEHLTIEGARDENGIALFCENYGEINSVTFANAKVTAPESDLTAVVCGVNHGSLVDVTVEKTCKVEGKDYVGGIAGYDDSATEKIRRGLKNAAEVTGSSYVGGIFGATKRPANDEDSETRGILECENTGAIRSSSDEGSFIGGITGFNSGRTLDTCTSTPAGELSKVAKATDLKGRFVGGIVGMQDGGLLKKCNTNGGLVAGGEYVGGIIGMNTEGALNELTDATISHNRADVAGKKYVGGIAGANVDAKITLKSSNKTLLGTDAQQAVLTADVTDIGVIADDGTWTTSESKLSNWTNEGMVVANDSYAGGIVGFNAGVIEECSSNVDVSSTSGSSQLTMLNELASDADKMGRLADFVGGIAGANVNKITAPTNNSRFVCVTAGRDYVGGILGYNAPGGSVTGYKVDDAYVYGRCFVGGLMGLNSEAKIYGENSTVNTIEVHPSRVEGEYFVGGIMGGSIIASDGDVTLHCVANNYQGNIISENGAGVGGLIGYNAMLENTEYCLALAKKLTAKLDDWLSLDEYAPVPNSNNYTNDLRRITRLLVNDIDGMDVGAEVETETDPARLHDQLPEASAHKFIIEPVVGAIPDQLNLEFSKISGYLYAGGAIGYNCKDTILETKNIVNFSDVSATGAVLENLQNTQPDAEKFSYVGGIIGRVTQHMRIENCSNDSNARVRSVGTYSGSLAELNEGVIDSCTTIGTVSPSSDNLGGIVGLNRYVDDEGDEDEGNTPTTSGYIVNCSLTGDLRGGDGVGGIAAVNRGLIENCSVGISLGITIAGSDEVGAIAAQNDGKIKNCTVVENTAIQGEKNVAGIAGKNGGSIIECTVDEAAITGDENVGGFVGYQNTSDVADVVVEDLINSSTLTGNNYVGGIIGMADGKLTVKNCKNTKPISATAENGFAGGILAFGNNSQSVIENCENSADISAPAGAAGGIVGYSMGAVKNCSVTGSESKVLNITAGKNAGGIVGESGGSIDGCTLTNVTVSGAAGANGGDVGGVVGLNKGSVGIANATNLSVTGAANGGTLGGLAGQNRGSITGADDRTSFNATVTLDPQFVGYTGGIVGWNRGEEPAKAELKNYTFAGKVSAGGSSLYGYGGVVGVNGDPNSLTNTALIENCRVNSAVNYKVSADKLNDWDRNDIASDADCTVLTTVKADVCVGGIAGLNCQYSTVSNSTLDSCYIRGYYGYVGGIVGHNKGDVLNCRAAKTDKTVIEAQKTGTTDKDINNGFLVKVYMYNGDIGGIVGRTSRTAAVENCATGHDWAVLVSPASTETTTLNTEGTDNTCAGIIGYNAADDDLIGLENFARVRKRGLIDCTIGGGIIGRQEKTTSSSWTVASCTNYGNVETGTRAGGIIGQWKYNGGTLLNCQNYGCIIARKGEGSGGIVGSTYGASANQRYNVTACFNYGTVKEGKSGGIVGCATASTNAKVIIIDCVNTGAVGNGGILGSKDGKTISVDMSRCINYNSAAKYGFVGSSGSVTFTNSIYVPENKSIAESPNPTHLNFVLQNGGDSVAANTNPVTLHVTQNGTKFKAEGSVQGTTEAYVIPELDLNPNAAENKGKPYENYIAINAQLVAFLKGLQGGVPEKPKNLTVTTSDGAYLAKWDAADNAYRYDVTVEVGTGDGDSFVAQSESKQTYTSLENRLSFAIDSKYEGQGLNIRVSVATINGNEEPSETTTAFSPVRTSLVMPKAQFEMVYEGDALKGRWRLLNYDEYVETYGDDTSELSKIKITCKFSNENNVEFNVAEKQSTLKDFNATNNSLTTEVTASGADYISSLAFSVQTQKFGMSKMTSGKMDEQLTIVSTEPYLTGRHPDKLVCHLSLQKKSEQVLRRTELVVANTDLGDGVEVVIAESHNDRITATSNLSMNLAAQLKANQPCMVRSYPWGTQGVVDGTNYISGCAYGHEVAKNVSVASLTDIVDPWAPETKIYDAEAKTLTKGYVLSLNKIDGTYNVYYSVMLASTNTPKDGQSQFIIKPISALPAVVTPVLNPNYETLADGRTKFTWTAADTDIANDTFEATVMATTFDNRTVKVAVPTDAIANTYDGGSLTLNLASSNYRSVEIVITRLGTEENGETRKLGSMSEAVTYAIPRKLPAMGAPGVSPKDNSDVKYDVSWASESGFAQDDTKGYTLWLSTAETLENPIALATPSTLGATAEKVTVDLEDYQRQPVWLYLTAHCKESPINYTEDSDNNAVTNITVAGRIELNNPESVVSLSHTYDSEKAITVEQFNSDLSIFASDPSNTAAGSFLLQAAILPTNAQTDGAPASMDSGLIVAWDGKSPVTRTMQSTVPNSLRAPSSYKLSGTTGFSDDYAGMWVCARVRAASVSTDLEYSKNSLWTKYKWMQLPRVQLDAPHSEGQLVPQYLENSATYTVRGSAAGEDPETLTLQQAALEWTWDKHAQDCNITIVGKDNTGVDKTFGIKLSRAENTGTISAFNTSENTVLPAVTNTAMTGSVTNPEDSERSTTFTWTQSQSTAEAPPQYGDTITYTDSVGNRTVDVETRLIVTDELDANGDVTLTRCTLLLPDYDAATVNGQVEDAVFNTKSVALQYVAREQDRYADSLPVTWAWADHTATTFANNSYVFNGGVS